MTVTFAWTDAGLNGSLASNKIETGMSTPFAY